MEYTENELWQRWVDFFQDRHIEASRLDGRGGAIRATQQDYYSKLLEVATLYPDKRSIEIDYGDLAAFDCDMAEYFLDNPQNGVWAGERAMDTVLPVDLQGRAIHLRLTRLPTRTEARMNRILIRDLRTKDLGNFVSVEGVIRKTTEVRPKNIIATFQCVRCGALVRQSQQDSICLKEPIECDKDQGGCGKGGNQTAFRILTDKSMFTGDQGFNIDPSRLSLNVDTQNVRIEELPEDVDGGCQPQRLICTMEDDLTGRILPGQRVILNGILRSKFRDKGTQKLTIFDIYLQVHSYEGVDKDTEIEISKEEQEQIEEWARDPNIHDIIRQSIAPSIYGFNTEKLAAALQLFGGVAKTLLDGTKIRGDIHILMVGDTGTGKSRILRFMASLNPRGIFTSGKTASAAGLTAAAVQDTSMDGDGRWSLEAGALVMGDKAMVCIDEMDKMTPQDRSSLHEAMEQQTISISKAGIQATLPARCPILAAANPKLGRYEESSPIAKQIDLPPTLLSRFDAIFPVSDKPNQKHDRHLANMILTSHQIGCNIKKHEAGQPQEIMSPETKEMAAEQKPIISADMMKKYAFYARQNIYPYLTDKVKEVLVDFYVGVRKLGEGEGESVPMTARQIEALQRFAEASAKMRLSHRIEMEDAERAISIMEYYLGKVARDGDSLDIDIIATGISTSQRSRMITIATIVKDLSGKDPAPIDDIVAAAGRSGIQGDVVRETLYRLKQDGRVFEPALGKYRVVI